MQYNFEWDPVKARANLRKHGVSFERAAEAFLDPFMISIFDDDHREQEDRWITVGKDHNEIVLVVIHTFREIDAENVMIRLISVRRATTQESRQYSTR